MSSEGHLTTTLTTAKPDFRALCAAGVDSLDAATDPDDLGFRASQWIADARAALAEPQQGAPTMPASVESLPEQQRRWYTLGWSAALSFTRYGAQPVPVAVAEAQP